MDLGSTTCTSICTGAYRNLATALGVSDEASLISLSFELVEPAEALLNRLPVDTRPVFGRPPKQNRERWLDDNTVVDEWGITFRRPKDWAQYDMIHHPLEEATSIDDIARHRWPDPFDPGRVAGLKDRARSLREDTDYAVVGDLVNTGFFEPSWYVRGLPQFMEDLVLRPDFATALMEKICGLQMQRFTPYLAAVGKYLDVVVVGDDLATQRGPFISPQLYRKMVKPIQRKYFAFIKEHTSAKLFYHSCGNIVPLLDDLIEVGIDAINPVQVSADQMDIEELKKRFGDRVVFWGAIDTHRVLPFGNPEEVREAVRRAVKVLGEDGGFMLAAVHNVQDDVPAANLLAMLGEASGVAIPSIEQ